MLPPTRGAENTLEVFLVSPFMGSEGLDNDFGVKRHGVLGSLLGTPERLPYVFHVCQAVDRFG